MLKCNMDGSWKEGRGGIGIIVQNSRGLVVLSGIFSLMSAISPLHAEILAVNKGLEVVVAFQITRVYIETDCIGVLQGVRNSAMEKSILGHSLKEVRERMWCIEHVSLLHTKREANNPAHELSKLGCLAEESCIWYAEVPPSVSFAVEADSFFE